MFDGLTLTLEGALFTVTLQVAVLPLKVEKSLLQISMLELLHRQALKLRTYIEDALYPYIALQDCLVVDMERIEDTPIIYNTITQKVYENGQWSKQDLDLHGKLLIYVKSSPPMPAATEQINNGF